MGSRSLATDYIGGFLPPCGDRSSACKDCRAIAKQLGLERPLYIVLDHTVEEFLEDRNSQSEQGRPIRFSSNRLVAAGQFVGLAEALNALVDPSYPKGAFRAPLRKA